MALVFIHTGHLVLTRFFSLKAEQQREQEKRLERGPMTNVMATLSNIGGALC